MSNNKAIVLAAMLIAATAVGCEGPEEREAAYLNRGKALFEQGKLVKARIEFKNARQINPVGVEALFYLARISERFGELRPAFATYLKVLEQDPKHVGAHLKLGEFYLMAGDLDKALEKSDTTIQFDPNSAGGHALRGAVFFRRNSYAEAKSQAEAALLLDPANIVATTVLAMVLQYDGRQDDALAVLARGIDRNPKEIQLKLVKSRLHAERTEIDAVRKLFNEIFELDPKNIAQRAKLAKLYIGWKRLDDAEQVLREAVALAPDDDKSKLLLVDFLANRRSIDDAEQELAGFIEKTPEKFSLRFALANFYRNNDLRDQAEKVYLAVIKENDLGPQGLAARVALARLRLAADDGKAADVLISEVLKNEPSYGGALILRAGRFLAAAKLREAIADLRAVLRDNPTSRQVLGMLAIAHLRSNELELASNTLNTLVDAYPLAHGARLQLAWILIRLGSHEVAQKHLDVVLKRVPNSVLALRLKTGVLVAQNAFTEAAAVANRVSKLPDSEALGLELLANVHFAAARYRDAAETYLKALTLAPGKLESLTGLTRAYVAQKQPDKAITYLSGVIANDPKNAEIRNLIGRLYRSEKKPELAEKAFLDAMRLESKLPTPYLNLASLRTGAGKLDGAVDALQEGTRNLPDDFSIGYALAMAYRNSGRFNEAAAQFQALLERNSGLDMVANNYAAMIAESKFDDSAMLEKALGLAERFQTSKNPFYLDTLGWLHYRRGDLNQAQIFIERAVQNGPNLPELRYHLGMVHFKSGAVDRARQELKQAVVTGAKYSGIDEARSTLASLPSPEAAK